jgi:hypothetical protein
VSWETFVGNAGARTEIYSIEDIAPTNDGRAVEFTVSERDGTLHPFVCETMNLAALLVALERNFVAAKRRSEGLRGLPLSSYEAEQMPVVHPGSIGLATSPKGDLVLVVQTVEPTTGLSEARNFGVIVPAGNVDALINLLKKVRNVRRPVRRPRPRH